MTLVEEIKEGIESLRLEDYRRLRSWFVERDWQLWDQQIEEDSASGKLDWLIEEANKEK